MDASNKLIKLVLVKTKFTSEIVIELFFKMECTLKIRILEYIEISLFVLI